MLVSRVYPFETLVATVTTRPRPLSDPLCTHSGSDTDALKRQQACSCQLVRIHASRVGLTLAGVPDTEMAKGDDDATAADRVEAGHGQPAEAAGSACDAAIPMCIL